MYEKSPSIYDKLLEQGAPIFSKIYAHPYNQELFAGSLPKDKFNDYLKKDVIYLKEFSKAIKRIRVSQELKPQFEAMSAYIKESELGIHHQYFNSKEKKRFFHLFTKKVEPTDRSALIKYIKHIKTASEKKSIEEAIASLLPCFMTYYFMGRDMLAAPTYNGNPNPYAEWISYYTDEQFRKAKNFFIKVLEQLTKDVTPEMEQKIIKAFLESAKCELELYDSAFYLSKEEKQQKQAQDELVYKTLEYRSETRPERDESKVAEYEPSVSVSM
jgi:thiaminase/transcriptional activator TenA